MVDSWLRKGPRLTNQPAAHGVADLFEWAQPGQQRATDGGTARFDAPSARTGAGFTSLGNLGDGGGWGLAKGAGQAQVAAGAPDWARYTGGHTGSSYQHLLDQGFDPWRNLAQYMPGGISSPNSGPATHRYAQGGEDDLGEVWRWTNDIIAAYAQQGKTLTDRDKAQIWLANVERLKSGYEQPDNTSGPWSGSQFANFGGGQPRTDTLGMPTSPGWGGAGTDWRSANPGTTPPMYYQQQGGEKMVQPYNGNSPLNDRSLPNQVSGAFPNQPMDYVPPKASVTTPTTNAPGTFDVGYINRQSPDLVVRDLMTNRGFKSGVHTRFGDMIQDLLGRVVPTMMDLYVDPKGNPATDKLANAAQLLDPYLFGGAGTLGANLQGFSREMLGQLAGSMPGLTIPQQEQLIKSATALNVLMNNDYQKAATMDRLDQGFQDYDYADRAGIQAGKPINMSLWDYLLANNPGLMPYGK